jgi:hypothetical protein
MDAACVPPRPAAWATAGAKTSFIPLSANDGTCLNALKIDIAAFIPD